MGEKGKFIISVIELKGFDNRKASDVCSSSIHRGHTVFRAFLERKREKKSSCECK